MKATLLGIILLALCRTVQAEQMPVEALPRGEQMPVEPLSLEAARAEALRNHPDYAASQLRGLLAQEALKVARAGYYPTANGFVTAVDTANANTRILAGGLNNPNVEERAGEGIAVSQLITDFGRTTNLTRSAKSDVRAAGESVQASREQILLNVEANYLAALQAQAVLNVAGKTLETRNIVVQRVTALAQNKLKSDLDVSFAQVAAEQAELLVQNASGDVERAMASLGSAMGRRAPATFALTDKPQPLSPPDDLSALVATALRQRPDLVGLRYQVDSARSLAAAEKDANYPTISALGVIGNAFAHDDRLPNRYAAAGVQLSVPLFAGGAYLARQHEAEIRARVAAESLRSAEDTVVQNVRLALVAVKTAQKRLITTRALAKHATQAFNLAEARYKVGSSSIVEFSDAQLNQTYADIALANAEYDTQVQMAVLNYQTGTVR